MKKLILISVLTCVILALPLIRVYSQVQVTTEVAASAMTSVSIVVPIAARETSQLSFGRFYPGQTGGTITISPQGNPETTSGVNVVSATSAGIFSVSGQGDATFAINLPNGPAILTSSDGTKTMEVSNWVSVPENGDAKVRLQGGAQEVRIGATLRVGSLDENPKGIYEGTYEITFGYN
jgi:hypothetical protein